MTQLRLSALSSAVAATLWSSLAVGQSSITGQGYFTGGGSFGPGPNGPLAYIGPNGLNYGNTVFTNFDVQNDGTIDPGASPTFSQDLLAGPGYAGMTSIVGGNLLLGQSSRLNLDLKSTTSFDNVNLTTGNITLDGKIKVTLDPTYVPRLGDSFKILSAPTFQPILPAVQAQTLQFSVPNLSNGLYLAPLLIQPIDGSRQELDLRVINQAIYLDWTTPINGVPKQMTDPQTGQPFIVFAPGSSAPLANPYPAGFQDAVKTNLEKIISLLNVAIPIYDSRTDARPTNST